jgi:hypothetical protein
LKKTRLPSREKKPSESLLFAGFGTRRHLSPSIDLTPTVSRTCGPASFQPTSQRRSGESWKSVKPARFLTRPDFQSTPQTLKSETKTISRGEAQATSVHQLSRDA